MKKIIVVIACSIFLFAKVQAQDTKMQNEKQPVSTYCAMLKDGKMMLMAEGKQVNSDVILANGTRIIADGTVIKSDKSETVLKNGECIDQDGSIITPDKNKGEMKEENKMDKK